MAGGAVDAVYVLAISRKPSSTLCATQPGRTCHRQFHGRTLEGQSTPVARQRTEFARAAAQTPPAISPKIVQRVRSDRASTDHNLTACCAPAVVLRRPVNTRRTWSPSERPPNTGPQHRLGAIETEACRRLALSANAGQCFHYFLDNRTGPNAAYCKKEETP